MSAFELSGRRLLERASPRSPTNVSSKFQPGLRNLRQYTRYVAFRQASGRRYRVGPRKLGIGLPAALFLENLQTDIDALVADVDARTGDDPLDVFLALVTEGAALQSILSPGRIPRARGLRQTHAIEECPWGPPRVGGARRRPDTRRSARE